jgi:hypothetical protein
MNRIDRSYACPSKQYGRVQGRSGPVGLSEKEQQTTIDIILLLSGLNIGKKTQFDVGEKDGGAVGKNTYRGASIVLQENR